MMLLISTLDAGASGSSRSGLGIRLSVFGLLYFLAHKLASLFPDSAQVLNAVWPAAGVGLAALLLNPRRQWLAMLAILFAAGNLANLTSGRPVAASFGFMVANIFETAACAWLISHYCGQLVTFARVSEVVALACGAALVNACTALIGAGVAALTTGASFWGFYRTWWIADGLGILLITPLIVAWVESWGRRRVLPWNHRVEAGSLAMVGCALTWMIFGDAARKMSFVIPQPYMLMVVVSWTALRFGVRMTATLLVALAAIAITCTATARSVFPLGGQDPTDRVLEVQTFLAISSLTGMLLAASLSEQRLTETARRESEERYRRLFDVASDAIFLVDCETGQIMDVNEATSRLYGYTREEFLRMKATDVSVEPAETGQVRALHQAQAELRRHRKKNGSIFPVEITGGSFDCQGRKVNVSAVRDTTDRMAAEASQRKLQLEKSRLLERLQVVLSQMPVACIVKDLDFNVTYFNPAAERIFGYTAEEVVGRSSFETFDSRVAVSQFEEIARRLAAGEVTVNATTEAVARDGRIVVCEWLRTVLRGEDGTLSGYLVMAQDVTQRYATEMEIRKLSRAVTQSPVSIMITDAEGNIDYVNPRFTALTGYTLEEVRGQNPRVLKSGQTPSEEYQALWESISAGREWCGIFHNKKKNGDLYWEAASVSPVLDETGRITHFLAVKEDITRRKEAEEALIASEALYHSLVENLPQRIFRRDTEGRLTFVNGEFCRFLGKEPNDILGKTVLDLYPLMMAEKVTSEDRKVMASGQVYETEETRPLPQGGVEIVQVIKTPIRDARGQVVGLQGIIWDVSERHRLEERLRQSQKLESIGQLAGGIAHDFNNILGAILLHLNLMKMSGKIQPQMAGSLTELEEQTERAAGLTRQLLLFSRKTVMQVRILDIRELLDSLMKMLRRLIGEHITVELNRGPEPFWIEADPGMVEQVVMNLMVNARDAMSKGGRLTIEVCQEEIGDNVLSRSPEARVGSFACLKVADTGHGMDETILKRLFEPFFTTKEAGKGTGLGLATVYSIVKQHHGWIEVQSAVQQGTTFRVFLPLAAKPVEEDPVVKPSAMPEGSETILLVEDNLSLRRPTCLFLRRQGYAVLEAANGAEALRRWEQKQDRISLLLTDMIMPGAMDGLELAERLLAEKPNLKVIISSGYSAELAQRARPTPEAITFVQKPCLPIELARMVRACLDRKV